MLARQLTSLLLALALAALSLAGCRRGGNTFVIAYSDNVSTLDPIGSVTVDAASERMRVLMFNSLVRKSEKFEYVGDLASYQRSDDGLTYTFTLRDGVKFHDGKPLTSADAKYTLDTLLFTDLAGKSGKAASFFEGAGASRQAYVTAVEAPDARTLVLRLRKVFPQLLPNLVPVSIIPQGSAAAQKDKPVGTGPFKFVRWDQSQQVLDLEANKDYWEGPPQIPALRVRVITDPNAMQAELRSGRAQMAPLPTNLSPDAVKSLSQDASLQVMQFPGANVNHLTFNVTSPPLDKVQVRQAIAYALDREAIIRDLLLGQFQLAHSILPENSWAYSPGQKYGFDPERAKKLLDEAGFRDPDGDGPQMRFKQDIVIKINAASAAARNISSVMQDYLKKVGVPLQIETVENNTLRSQLLLGQFQMTYGQWVGGNTDPVFYKDLFYSTEIPSSERAARNRSRYKNTELDAIIDEAFNTTDQTKAAGLYAKAQDIISRDLPLFPLWYQANIVVARKGVGQISVRPDGDWDFIRKVTPGGQ
ncbi:MAG TPA: ABC transporter substrate-binding protein [Pyrinomonadaceae bacterium]|jgi:peptide/nickel transport system substrate-binding protein